MVLGSSFGDFKNYKLGIVSHHGTVLKQKCLLS